MNYNALGTWMILPYVEIATLLATQLDFIIIDMEHGNFNYKDVMACTAAAHCHGAHVFARASSNNEHELLRLMDNGVNGIIVPHIQTAQDVQKFLDYTNFPPTGQRGYTPFVYSGKYGEAKKDPKYKDDSNNKLLRGVLIEDMTGYNNLEDILDFPIDIVYIGIYDLSMSLGLPLDDPEVKRLFKDIARRTVKSGKEVMAIFHNTESLGFLVDNDVHYMAYKTDTAILHDALEEVNATF